MVSLDRPIVTTTASTRCLVKQIQLICYSQRVNITSQYNNSGSSRCSKWPKDRIVAVANIAGSLYKEKEAEEKDYHKLLLNWCSRKYWHVQ